MCAHFCLLCERVWSQQHKVACSANPNGSTEQTCSYTIAVAACHLPQPPRRGGPPPTTWGGFSSQHLDYRGGLLHAPWDPERLEAWGEETVIRRGVLNRRLDSLSHLEYNYINVYHWWKTSCSNMSTDSLWALGFEHRTIHLGFEHETTRLLSKISGVHVEILLDISSRCSFYRRSVSGDVVLHTWCNSRAWPKRLH